MEFGEVLVFVEVIIPTEAVSKRQGLTLGEFVAGTPIVLEKNCSFDESSGIIFNVDN